MRLMSIDAVVPGMVLSRPVYGVDGRRWLAQGVELTQHYVDRLKELGILMIYIQESGIADVDAHDVVSEETRAKAIAVVRKMLAEASRGTMQAKKSALYAEAGDVVGAIIDELRSKMRTVVSLLNLKSFDGYTYEHSVNCCILGVMTGMGLRYHEAKLKNLGIGLLMHDIGKVEVPRDILNKAGSLDPWEFQKVQMHPEAGFRLLSEDDEISATSRAICLQHHERCNGSGYPRGLTLTSIQEFSRIAAVVDVYDALTSDRVYRRAHMPSQAVEFLRKGAGVEFDREIVQEFLAHVAPYPIGATVRLSTGEAAVVVDINADDVSRPVVRILEQDGEARSQAGEEIDLSKHQDISVVSCNCKGP